MAAVMECGISQQGKKLMGISRTIPVVALLCFLFSVQVARATTVRYVPFEEQVDSAAVIVLAVASESRSYWNASHSVILTDVSFRVEQALKGSPGLSFKVTVPGGVVDRVGQEVYGAPSFKVGGRYVLFLEPIGDGNYRVVGFSQGSYSVAKAANGKSKVAPQLAGAEKVHVIGGRSAASASGQGLEEFLSRIRSRLAGNSARSMEKQK